MKILFRCVASAVLLWTAGSLGADLDSIGVLLLRAVSGDLNGAGIRVTQVEAPDSTNELVTFQVTPSQVGHPVSLFTYFVGPPLHPSEQSSESYPNSLGGRSGHAVAVANHFYGIPLGVSTNVLHVDNYEANYFFDRIVPDNIAIHSRIVNQTFIVPSDVADQRLFDSAYDNYAAEHGILFISGIGNGGAVNPPATSYNGIGVGAYGGASSIGPTPDNGRAKPDIVAPAEVTSYSTPQVSGAATILLQAALRGDGGADTNAAADSRTIKALLLNGAVKPSNWTAPAPSPLDPRHGAGVLNVFNSYNQLAGGKHGAIETSVVPSGAAHPASTALSSVPSLHGFDFDSIESSAGSETVQHYLFDLSSGISNALFTCTATLVWNRQSGQTDINNLELFLYEVQSGQLIAASTSAVDNVEHIYVQNLPQGRYDLQVLKRNGGMVSASETYALAFEFFAMPLSIAMDNSSVRLSWPDYPAGFVLQTTTNVVDSTSWSPVNVIPIHTNRRQEVILDAMDVGRFFRLKRP